MIKTTIGTKTFETGAIYRSTEYIRGQQRETLTLHIPTSEIAYEELHSMVKDREALSKITTQNHDENDSESPVSTSSFDNYIVTAESLISVTSEILDPAKPMEFTEVFVVKLGKLTYVEEQLQKLGINPLGQ